MSRGVYIGASPWSVACVCMHSGHHMREPMARDVCICARAHGPSRVYACAPPLNCASLWPAMCVYMREPMAPRVCMHVYHPSPREPIARTECEFQLHVSPCSVGNDLAVANTIAVESSLYRPTAYMREPMALRLLVWLKCVPSMCTYTCEPMSQPVCVCMYCATHARIFRVIPPTTRTLHNRLTRRHHRLSQDRLQHRLPQVCLGRRHATIVRPRPRASFF